MKGCSLFATVCQTALFSVLGMSASYGNAGLDEAHSPTSDAQVARPAVEFVCESGASYPVTVGIVEEQGSRQATPLVRWLPAYYTDAAIAIANCETVAQRLQVLYQQGYLDQNKQLVMSEQSGESVVCIGTTQGCTVEETIFALPKADGKPSKAVFDEMMPSAFRLRGDFRMLKLRWLPW